MGILRSAIERSKTLIIIEIVVKTEGQSLVNPSVYFNPMANAISNIPARKSIIHTMFPPLVLAN
tara:strand:- start:2891 stop:3082 length:192 start_codon:yes stop_codon:yes gene_type:complete